MHIRLGTDEDVPNVMPLLAEFHLSLGSTYPPLNPHKTVMEMFAVVKNGLLLIAETHDKKIAGILALNKTKYLFSDYEFIADVVYFVSMEFRQSSAGRQLLDAAKKISEEMKVPLMMIINTNVDAQRKDRLYERAGFTYMGGMFVKGV